MLKLIRVGVAVGVLVGAAAAGVSTSSTTGSSRIQTVAAPALDAVDQQMAIEMAAYYKLTPGEAQVRVADQRAAVQLEQSLPPSLAAKWGGGVVDQQSGGRRRWFVTTPAAQRELTAVVASLPVAKRPAVTIVKHTLAQLETGVDQLAATLDAQGAVVSNVAVDVETNSLTVAVPTDGTGLLQAAGSGAPAAAPLLESVSSVGVPSSPAATSAPDWQANSARAHAVLTAFEQVSGIAAAVRPDAAPAVGVNTGCTPAEVAGGTQRTLQCDDPMRGGTAIFRSRSTSTPAPEVSCTAGFQVRSRSDNALYLLTAGHCARQPNGAGDRGVRWYSQLPKDGYQSHWIGSWWRSVNNTNDGDAGLITVDNLLGWNAGHPIVYVGPSANAGKQTTQSPGYSIRGMGVWSTLDQNSWLCKTGGVDWTDCGRYAGPMSVWLDGIKHLVRTFDTMHLCGGDSGGPVVGNGLGWGIVLAGPDAARSGSASWQSGGGISGGSQCYRDTWVLALDRPLDALNVRLVTTARP